MLHRIRGLSAQQGWKGARRTKVSSHFVVALALGITPVPACTAQGEGSGTKRADRPDTPIGRELTLCAKGCPTFVRVPPAPKGMRPIRFVAKFELTWNEYWAAFDAGVCKIPQPNLGPGSTTKNTIPDNINYLRIDWPIGQLGPADVQCYMAWLQKSTGYIVALPSESEWEWFARAGRVDAKYPWGDDADPSREALYGNPIGRRLPIPVENRFGGEYVSGAKGGQFAPNNWGIYDLMGSERELTSDIVSGEELYRRNPKSKFSLIFRNNKNVALKGSDASDPEWASIGISGRRFGMILDDHYSTAVSVRLILIEGNN